LRASLGSTVWNVLQEKRVSTRPSSVKTKSGLKLTFRKYIGVVNSPLKEIE